MASQIGIWRIPEELPTTFHGRVLRQRRISHVIRRHLSEVAAWILGLLFGDGAHICSRTLGQSLSVGPPVALRTLLFDLLGEAFLFTTQLCEPLIFRYEIL